MTVTNITALRVQNTLWFKQLALSNWIKTNLNVAVLTANRKLKFLQDDDAGL